MENVYEVQYPIYDMLFILLSDNQVHSIGQDGCQDLSMTLSNCPVQIATENDKARTVCNAVRFAVRFYTYTVGWIKKIYFKLYL